LGTVSEGNAWSADERRTFQRAVAHAAKASFYAAALVDEMMADGPRLDDLLLRVEDAVLELGSARMEVRLIRPADS
jgi:hypothetical protein